MRTVHRNDTAEAVKSPEIGRHRAIALRKPQRRARDSDIGEPDCAASVIVREKIAASMLAHEGIAAIWRLHIAAAEAHRTGHPRCCGVND